MIPSVVLENVLGVLSCVHNEKVEVKNHHPFGSSISKTWMLETSVGDFFLKHHQNKNFPEMFEAEAKGLKFIGETKSFRVPQVIQVGEENIEESYLLLQFIHESPGSEKMFENFENRNFHQQLFKWHILIRKKIRLLHASSIFSPWRISRPFVASGR